MNKDLLRKLNQNLCDLISTSQTGTSEVTVLLEQVINILSTQNENLRPILYCGANCELTGAVAFVLSEVDGSLIKIYYDKDLEETEDPPTGNPCDTYCFQDDYEFKHLETCFTDGRFNYTRITCVVYRNGEFFNEVILWLLPDGTTTNVEPPNLKRCLDDPSVCEPWIGGGTGDQLPTEEVTDFTLMLGDCTDCSGYLNTSIGQVPFFSNMDCLSVPSANCSYTIEGLVLNSSPRCNIEDIIWYASRKK